MGEMRGDPNAARMNKIEWCSQNNCLKELNRIDDMQTEFEWKLLPGSTTTGILEEIQNFMKCVQCELEHSNGRIIFMSMFEEICGEKTTIQKNVIRILLKLGSMLAGSIAVIGLFIGLGLEKTWYETCADKTKREWDKTAATMILQKVTESGHPVFRSSSVFERGKLDIKEYGKRSTRFDDDEGNVEILLRTVISVNQLSIYGILADWCKNWDKNSSEESAPSSDGSESSGTL